MKIVFLVRTLTFGGAERQLVALAKGLHARGHQVCVMVFYPGGPLEAELDAIGVPVLDAAKHGRWDVPGFLWRLARTLRAARADVVHGYLGTSNAISLALRPLHRAKVVWGVRATDIELSPDDWLGRFEAQLEQRSARFADLIIANSHSGRDDALVRGFPPAKTIVIPNGIDTDRFQFDPAGRAAVRAELELADGDLLLGRVGRIYPQKDYASFLRAAARIASRFPNAKFLCVGSGTTTLEIELRTLATRLGIADRVIWSSARADMPAVYSAMDLAISSSAYGEGTPNVVAEAMACGVPCVVTDVGDSAQVVGDLGAVVPAGDADELASAAIAAIERVRGGAIDRAALRARIVTSFSLERLIERSEAVLAAVISPDAHPQPEMSEVSA